MVEREVEIGPEGIVLADDRELRGGIEGVVVKPEQVDRACARGIVVEAAIAGGADGQREVRQRNRAAKPRPGTQFRNRKVLAAAIVAADDTFEDGELEICCHEREEVDRARFGQAVAKTGIARNADGQPLAVERNRGAECVELPDPCNRRAQTAGIARADGTAQLRTAEIGIGKGEQIDRARIGRRCAVAEAIVAPGANNQPVAVQ